MVCVAGVAGVVCVCIQAIEQRCSGCRKKIRSIILESREKLVDEWLDSQKGIVATGIGCTQRDSAADCLKTAFEHVNGPIHTDLGSKTADILGDFRVALTQLFNQRFKTLFVKTFNYKGHGKCVALDRVALAFVYFVFVLVVIVVIVVVLVVVVVVVVVLVRVEGHAAHVHVLHPVIALIVSRHFAFDASTTTGITTGTSTTTRGGSASGVHRLGLAQCTALATAAGRKRKPCSWQNNSTHVVTIGLVECLGESMGSE